MIEKNDGKTVLTLELPQGEEYEAASALMWACYYHEAYAGDEAHRLTTSTPTPGAIVAHWQTRHRLCQWLAHVLEPKVETLRREKIKAERRLS